MHSSNEGKTKTKNCSPGQREEDDRTCLVNYVGCSDFFQRTDYNLGHLIDLQFISFPFSPFQYIFELDSGEPSVYIPKPSFALQVTVNAQWNVEVTRQPSVGSIEVQGCSIAKQCGYLTLLQGVLASFSSQTQLSYCIGIIPVNYIQIEPSASNGLVTNF